MTFWADTLENDMAHEAGRRKGRQEAAKEIICFLLNDDGRPKVVSKYIERACKKLEAWYKSDDQTSVVR